MRLDIIIINFIVRLLIICLNNPTIVLNNNHHNAEPKNTPKTIFTDDLDTGPISIPANGKPENNSFN